MKYIFYILPFLSLVSSLSKKTPLVKTSPPLVDIVKPVIRPATAPFTNVDIFKPDVLVKGFDLSFLREAELKHGRIAMLATLILPTLEVFTDDLGINQFQNLPGDYQLGICTLMFIGEFASMFRGWENPTKKLFGLKDTYQPGDFGFQLWKKNDEETNIQMDKELNNGRLAMVGSLGMIVQELVTHQQLF